MNELTLLRTLRDDVSEPSAEQLAPSLASLEARMRGEPIPHTPRPARIRPWALATSGALVAAAAVTAIVISVQIAAPTVPSTMNESTTSPPSLVASEFVARTSSDSATANEVYMSSPRELGSLSDLVLSGHVVSVIPGPAISTNSTPQFTLNSVVYIEVAPEFVAHGEYPAGENVWIVLNHVGPADIPVYQEFLTPGTPVVAYLFEIDLSNGLDGGQDSASTLPPDSSPTVPGNGRFWLAASQGLIFDFGGEAENLAWPLLDLADTGALADTLPTGTLIGFPVDYVPPAGADG